MAAAGRTVGGRRTLIVGASFAGTRTAQALLGLGYVGEVILLDEQPYAPLRPPPLSKGVLASAAPTPLLAPSELSDPRLQLCTGSRVVDIDLDRHTVATAGGTTLCYDALVIATGDAARRRRGCAYAGPPAPAC